MLKFRTCILTGAAIVLTLAILVALIPGLMPKVMALALGLGVVGTTINELPRLSDVVLWEEGKDINLTRAAITIASGAKHVRGEVLGQISLGTATVAAAGQGGGGSNTGTGTLTMDATAPLQSGAIAGIYQVKILATGRVEVLDPKGVSLGEMEFGSGATITWNDRIKFALADNATTHFVAGDGFTVTVAAGSGKYVQLNLAALDGSQNAAAVLLYNADATSADVTATALVAGQGPAVLKANGLVWPVGISGPQQTAAIAQLLALGIQVRNDYGV